MSKTDTTIQCIRDAAATNNRIYYFDAVQRLYAGFEKIILTGCRAATGQNENAAATGAGNLPASFASVCKLPAINLPSPVNEMTLFPLPDKIFDVINSTVLQCMQNGAVSVAYFEDRLEELFVLLIPTEKKGGPIVPDATVRSMATALKKLWVVSARTPNELTVPQWQNTVPNDDYDWQVPNTSKSATMDLLNVYYRKKAMIEKALDEYVVSVQNETAQECVPLFTADAAADNLVLFLENEPCRFKAELYRLLCLGETRTVKKYTSKTELVKVIREARRNGK